MTRSAVRFLPALAAIFVAACAGTHGLAEGEVRECRKIEITGSKFPKQDCRTNVEWAKHDTAEAERSATMLNTNQSGANPATMN